MSAWGLVRAGLNTEEFTARIADKLLHDLTTRGLLLYAPAGLRPFLQSTFRVASGLTIDALTDAVATAEMVEGGADAVSAALEETMAAVEEAWAALIDEDINNAAARAWASEALVSVMAAWRAAHPPPPSDPDSPPSDAVGRPAGASPGSVRREKHDYAPSVLDPSRCARCGWSADEEVHRA